MRITRKVQNFCQNNTAFFRDNRHFFELALSEKDASYEKLSSVSRGLRRRGGEEERRRGGEEERRRGGEEERRRGGEEERRRGGEEERRRGGEEERRRGGEVERWRGRGKEERS